MGHEDRSPSASRFARWAVMLLLPLLLAAAALPWAREQLRPSRGATPPAAFHPEAMDATDPGAAPEPPRHAEAPSRGEIEASRAAEVEAARLRQRHLAGASVLAPRPAVTTPEGERVAPFQGFGLSVESTPAGARVLVSGREVGETPIVASVECAPGDEVAVVLEKRGFAAARRTVRCRADALLELSVRLAR